MNGRLPNHVVRFTPEPGQFGAGRVSVPFGPAQFRPMVRRKGGPKANGGQEKEAGLQGVGRAVPLPKTPPGRLES